MNGNSGMLIVVTALAFTAIAALAAYRWRQRLRVRHVEEWITAYLRTRYGLAPGGVKINCSDDPLWPVLVTIRQWGEKVIPHFRNGQATRG